MQTERGWLSSLFGGYRWRNPTKYRNPFSLASDMSFSGYHPLVESITPESFNLLRSPSFMSPQYMRGSNWLKPHLPIANSYRPTAASYAYPNYYPPMIPGSRPVLPYGTSTSPYHMASYSNPYASYASTAAGTATSGGAAIMPITMRHLNYGPPMITSPSIVYPVKVPYHLPSYPSSPASAASYPALNPFLSPAIRPAVTTYPYPMTPGIFPGSPYSYGTSSAPLPSYAASASAPVVSTVASNNNNNNSNSSKSSENSSSSSSSSKSSDLSFAESYRRLNVSRVTQMLGLEKMFGSASVPRITIVPAPVNHFTTSQHNNQQQFNSDGISSKHHNSSSSTKNYNFGYPLNVMPPPPPAQKSSSGSNQNSLSPQKPPIIVLPPPSLTNQVTQPSNNRNFILKPNQFVPIHSSSTNPPLIHTYTTNGINSNEFSQRFTATNHGPVYIPSSSTTPAPIFVPNNSNEPQNVNAIIEKIEKESDNENEDNGDDEDDHNGNRRKSSSASNTNYSSLMEQQESGFQALLKDIKNNNYHNNPSSDSLFSPRSFQTSLIPSSIDGKSWTPVVKK